MAGSRNVGDELRRRVKALRRLFGRPQHPPNATSTLPKTEQAAGCGEHGRSARYLRPRQLPSIYTAHSARVRLREFDNVPDLSGINEVIAKESSIVKEKQIALMNLHNYIQGIMSISFDRQVMFTCIHVARWDDLSIVLSSV